MGAELIKACKGVYHRNPWNLKQTQASDAGELALRYPQRKWWEGSIGVDDKGHAIFCHEMYSARGVCRVLAKYQIHRGCQTIQQMIARYAPADDTVGSVAGAPPNQPSAYADFIGKRTGWSVDRPKIFFQDDGRPLKGFDLQTLLAAMVSMECFAGCVYPLEFIESGIALYASQLETNPLKG